MDGIVEAICIIGGLLGLCFGTAYLIIKLWDWYTGVE